MAETPFDGKLPPGYAAQREAWYSPIFYIFDQDGKFVLACWPDSTIPLDAHLRHIWWQYTFPGAPPVIYLRHVQDPDWMPDAIRPAGYLALEEIGSLGG